VESGNDYLIQVKGNQPKLLKQCQQISKQEPQNKYQSKQRIRGRNECREVYVYNAIAGMDKEWMGLKRIIKVIRHGERNKQMYWDEHIYISSHKSTDAEFFAVGIRKHWGIENRLHWVKDVVQNEDNSRISDGNIASNLSLIKSCVINLFRLHGNQSITKAIEKYCNRIDQCLDLMRINHI
jgi:predicted transposase YbfD/YdcC